MNEQLIVNDSNEQILLMKEIKKMNYIKYLILIISVIRFILMFFIIFLIPFYPRTFRPNIFIIFLFLYITLIFPVLTILLLVNAITGTINRDFWAKKKNIIKFSFKSIFCCCCVMLKNVNYLKVITFIHGIIQFLSFICLVYYKIKEAFSSNSNIDINTHNPPRRRRFFPENPKKVNLKIIIHLIDSILLICLFYCFYYTEYFLHKIPKYLDYYKKLIIKNRNREAEYIRNTLPAKVEDYLPTEESEMKSI